MFGEFVEHLPQPGLGIDQSSVMQTPAITVPSDAVMPVLTHAQTEEHTSGWPCPRSAVRRRTRPGDNTRYRIIETTRAVSHAGPGD
jgi:hypothetical protein